MAPVRSGAATISGGVKRSSSVLLVAIAICLGAIHPSGQIILNGPNVAGTVGLNGVAFGSGSVYFSWPGGNVQVQLANADTDFSVRVEPDKVLSASVGMYSLQGGTNAYVQQNLWNITGPASAATAPLQLNFTRDAGRLIGTVSVTGGSVARVDISASKSVSANESFYGSATATATPFEAVLPFVAAARVSVQGSAILRASRGCDVPVTLSSQLVDVPANGSASPTWSFDLTNEQCNQASVQGHVTFTGLEGQNADVVPQQRYVQVSGLVSRSQSTDNTGSYAFSSLPPGSYYLYNYSYFNAPYSGFFPSGADISLSAGQLLTRDFNNTVGTAHTVFEPRGAWTLANTPSVYAYFSVYGSSGEYLGQSYDAADAATGKMDFVLAAGSARLEYLQAFFSKYDGLRSTWQYFNNYFYPATSPLRAAVATGARLDLGPLQVETSESLIVVQPANLEVGLANLRLWGFANIRNTAGTLIENPTIDLYSYAIGTAQNSVAVLVRGVPGTYQMSATGQGTDGATYSKQFELILGAPHNTGTGGGVVTPILIEDQTGGGSTSGSITFGNVTTPGETTVSASGSGPQAPGNFRVVGSGSRFYYDIQTTATFDPALGATLCLSYDDAGLNANQEARLTLQHYVCADPQTNTGCGWEDITSTGYPDTAGNKICGVTSSFSIFAILQPLDQDADGVVDAADNCPAVQNADQEDFDADGMGDACDSDVDGDDIDDTADNCPAVPNALQTDLDADKVGDICDPDVDGDSVTNDADNCRLNANASQADFDGDGSGDACDADDDNDGIVDGQDSCAGTSSGVLILANGCSSPQQLELACSRDALYRNHGEYVQCVAHAAEEQVAAGLISLEEKDAIVATAAKSDIGKK